MCEQHRRTYYEDVQRKSLSSNHEERRSNGAKFCPLRNVNAVCLNPRILTSGMERLRSSHRRRHRYSSDRHPLIETRPR